MVDVPFAFLRWTVPSILTANKYLTERYPANSMVATNKTANYTLDIILLFLLQINI